MNIHLKQRVITRGVTLAESSAAVMMVHGRTQTTNDILELADRIDLPGVHYLAPQAADNSWYPSGFMAPLADNEPSLSYALESYHARVSDLLKQGIPKTRLVLLGFSQGACLTAEYAVRHPGRYGGIVLFTGGVIGPVGTEWVNSGSFQGTPVFLGASDIDSWVPEPRVLETGFVFKQMGADTTTRIYKGMGHIVNDEEIEFARKMIKQVLSN
jgi:phospholipase/carboxylesterase